MCPKIRKHVELTYVVPKNFQCSRVFGSLGSTEIDSGSAVCLPFFRPPSTPDQMINSR